MEDMEYLQPGFDPNSLKMPQLRNILMTHDIQYPSSAKKPQLVDIFVHELKPQSRKLLAARDRVRRTSEGITNMPRDEEERQAPEDDAVSSMSAPRSRTSRKSVRAGTDDSVSETVPSPAKKGTVRRNTSKHDRQSDTEPEADAPKAILPRKSRKSEGMSRAKADGAGQTARPAMPESAFSDDNPFQSGSSPIVEDISRRRTLGTSSEKKKRSSSGRRKTDGSHIIKRSPEPQRDGVTVPSSHTFEMPVSSLNLDQDDYDQLEAGEDFTPEEQAELAEQRAVSGESALVPTRRKRSTNSKVPKSAPLVVLTALLGGFATWYRQEKIAVGYCGLGRLSDAQPPVQIPDWASFLQPVCEPCPQHATCYQGLETTCDQDFLLIPHPFAFGGVVPLPPSCEPDGEKARKVKAVADRAVETLRQRKADEECGTLKDEQGHQASAEISEEDLKKEVGKNKRRGMDDAEFEELWKGAIGEIAGREEVVASPDGRLLSSNSLARLPIGCAVRRSARLAVARHRQSVSLVTLLLALALYIRNRIVTARADKARVPSLVSTTLDRLATQAALHARGDGNVSEPWISVGQLRDDVLRDIFSDARRERVWARVRDVVERNANVRASVREGRGGDVSRVWEWIGSLGLLDSGAGGGGGGVATTQGRGKRVSFSPLPAAEVDDHEYEDEEVKGGGGGGKEMVQQQQRKWNEGRPIY